MNLARRGVLAAIAALALTPAWTLTASGQARIAFLEAGSASANAHFVEAFRKGMRSLGYEEGKNYILDVRWGEGRADRFPELLRELVAHQPDVVVVAATLGAIEAKKVVTSIPVVFVGVSDPQKAGLVESLAHPGGNMTGLSRVFGEGLLGKALQALRDIVPNASRIAIVWDADGEVDVRAREAEDAARALGMVPLRVPLHSVTDLEQAFALVRRERADAVMVIADPLTVRHRDEIVRLAKANRIPAVYEFAEFARAGGLVSYSASIPALFERAALYVDKILRGAHPSDLPIEQPTKFELVINAKTAKALGLTIPPSLLLRADEVIQ